MTGGERLQDSIQNLVDSPGGKIISDGADFLRKKAKFMVFIFLVGVIAAFSATKSVVAWLIDDSRLPDDVNIIVTSHRIHTSSISNCGKFWISHNFDFSDS